MNVNIIVLSEANHHGSPTQSAHVMVCVYPIAEEEKFSYSM